MLPTRTGETHEGVSLILLPLRWSLLQGIKILLQMTVMIKWGEEVTHRCQVVRAALTGHCSQKRQYTLSYKGASTLRWTVLCSFYRWRKLKLGRFTDLHRFTKLVSVKLLSQCLMYQFSSVAQSCLTLCNPMNHSMPGLPVHHQLPEFTQTHAHRLSDAIQPSHPLSSPSPPAPNPSQHQGLFQWVNSSHEVAKVLEFQLHHQSFQWTPRTDLLQNGLAGSPCSPRDS